MQLELPKILRYRSQSMRFLEDAVAQARNGRWSRVEDLMWGSLTLAVKGVALSRGRELDGDDEVREYAAQLGGELRDRRIREAFGRIADFTQTAQRVRRSRYGADRTAAMLEDVAAAVRRLWDLAPADDTEEESSRD